MDDRHAHRQLVKSIEDIQGGNRVVSLTYEIRLDNFNGDAVNVRLIDRLPQPKNADINMKLVSTGMEISENAKYLKTERDKGMLRWDLEVPADSWGADAMSFEYQFQLEYDKQLTVTELASAAGE